MNKEQILELIRKQEQELYSEYLELRYDYGYEDKATRYAAAQWNALLTILDKIEDENN
jgi:hypothetical protein